MSEFLTFLPWIIAASKPQIKQTNLLSNYFKRPYLPPPQENWLISGIQSHPSLFMICCLKKDEWTFNIFCQGLLQHPNPRSNKQTLLLSNYFKRPYLPPPQENWLISGIQSHPSLFTICCLKKDEWTLQQQNKQKIKYLYVRIALRSQYVYCIY